MVIVFGGLSIATGFVTSLGSACAVRFLLGAAEAAMLPGCSYFLSRWYRKSELVFRLSLFLVASPLAGGESISSPERSTIADALDCSFRWPFGQWNPQD